MPKPYVVVVDDEPEIRSTIKEYLELHGFEVGTADGGPALRRLFGERRPELILLDLNMPEEDGLSVARWLHGQARVGLIMVTAADTVVDRVAGLELGADDFVGKPFDLRELLARVRSVLRRLEGPVAGTGAPRSLRFGGYVLDVDGRRLHDPEGREVPLTAMEFDLLRALAENPKKVLNRDRLLNLTQNRDWDPFDRSIDLRIMRLRRKIERDPSKPRFIKTVRGGGYLLDPEGR